LNELGNEELLSANKNESGNQETRNDGSGKQVTDSIGKN
jgi:hypothetical protein